MSQSPALSVAALLVSIFAVLAALFAVFAPNVPTNDQRTAGAAQTSRTDEGEWLLNMVLNQRYLQKSYDAAEAGNWPLAEFYADKLAETSERLVEGGFMIDGVDVSAIAAEVSTPRTIRLQQAARSGNQTTHRDALDDLVVGCNTCHGRSGYPAIVIQSPGSAELFPTQSFSPSAPQTP